jgi:3-oxoacyl-[acyl-carrier protein] reductase
VNRKGAEAVATACREAGAQAVVLQGDLSSRDEARRVVAEFEGACGAVARAVVCAVGGAKDEPLLRTSEDSFDASVATNLSASAWLLQAACERWCDGGGHAVLLGSFAGAVGRVGGAGYAASKAGLVGLARAVAREFGDRGVRVNVVVPPFVRVGMGAEASEAFAEREMARSALRRSGDAREFAAFVMDVLATAGITGQVLSADSRIA